MTFVDRARALIGMEPRSARFSSETTPRPVAQVIHEMMHATGRVSRTEALSVPAIKRGRDIICGLATMPLDTIDASRNVVSIPLFQQIDPNVPNAVIVAQTLEDLLFDGVSWWLITEFDAEGWPIHARHLDVTQVTVNSPANGKTPAPLPSGLDPQGEILVDGKPIDPSRIVKFDSLNTPILRDGGRVIRRALALDRAAEMYANDPRPMDYFTPDADADPGTDEEIQEALDKWVMWRRRRATGYVPKALKYNEVQQPTPADLQLVGLQERVSIDMANLIGFDPDDFGVPVSSDTYNNAVDRRQDRINNVLSIYATALVGRLSMGDVTRPGHTVRLNYDGYLRADPMTRIQVAEKQLALGLITVDEYREREGLPALTAQQKREVETIKVQSTVGAPVNEIEAA
jgi:hypothetical protein